MELCLWALIIDYIQLYDSVLRWETAVFKSSHTPTFFKIQEFEFNSQKSLL